MHDDDDPIVQRPDETRIQPRPVPPLTDPDAVHVVHEEERVRVLPDADEVNVMHEEERVRVLPDGTVIRERDRVEQEQSWFRRYLPWILIAILGLLIIAGLVLWYVTKSDTKTVPTVVGLRSDAAVNRLQNDGFKVQIVPQSSTRPAGVVFGQNPAGGASVSKGSTVRLLVSKGRSLVTVPNAVGLSQVDARNRLVNAGFAVITAQVPSDQPVGTVTAQDPAAGTRVAPGTKVHINVSKGKAVVPVPSEVGNTLSNATAELEAKGFKVVTTPVPSSSPADTVVSQSPASGSAPKGSTVQLNVSQGPSATTTTATVTTPTTTVTTPTTTVTTPTTTTATVTTPTVTTP
jgi:beta-lactam-binding protein with PASTA domain